MPKVDRNCIKRVGVNYKLGKRILSTIKNADFKKVENEITNCVNNNYVSSKT
jgi:hypothetical protein